MTHPEVRQCQDEDSPQHGAVAIAGRDIMAGKWGVFHPEQGGHWTADATEIEDWKVLA